MRKFRVYRMVLFKEFWGWMGGNWTVHIVARGPAEAKVMFERKGLGAPDEMERIFAPTYGRGPSRHIKRSTRYREDMPEKE